MGVNVWQLYKYVIILYNETTVHKYSMYRMQASAQAYITYTTYLSFGDDYEGVDELQLGLQVRGLVHILTALLHHSSYCLQEHTCIQHLDKS